MTAATEGGDDSRGRPPADPRAILAVLHTHLVDFLVVGGLAVIAHGYTRFTQDLDILPSPADANAARLAAALRELEAVAAGMRGERLPLDLTHPESLVVGNYFLITKHGAMDLFNGPRPDLLRYRRLDAAAVELEVLGTTIKVISKADLIAMKREAGRPKDLADIAALTEVERNP
ncbi:MAG TPA: hypothetical protein VK919_09505 [Solirubrobacterales bacterium]|nr:hypothetical protein [Solirubrobacterales bacterium]